MIEYPFNFEKIPALFVERINRFVIHAEVKGQVEKCYLANPGRLWELLIPHETELLLFRNKKSESIPFTVLACKKNKNWVMLHTHLTNRVIKFLVNQGKIPFYRGFKVAVQEVKHKSSRFDLLLKNGSETVYLEVKTCTLFGSKVSMFPDAVTSRGQRHLMELKKISKSGVKTSVLFVVMSEDVEFFLPCYHIDFEFSKTLIEVKDHVDIKAVSLCWDNSLTFVQKVKELKIPFSFIEKALKDKGVYIIISELPQNSVINIGSLGNIEFQKGFYVYVGSAKKGLMSRIKRHKGNVKKVYWHIDYFLKKARVIKDIAIITEEELECELSRRILSFSEGFIQDFGCSDCKCRSHLFYFKYNPLFNRSIIEMVQYFWMDNLAV